MKDFLSVGEMAELFGLNKQTLHYYDKINLFKPDHINENRNRIYKFEQCYKLASICNMRYLGYSIKSIKEILENQNKETSIEAMKIQSDTIDKEISKLLGLKETINRKISFVNDESKDIGMEGYLFKDFSERYYLEIGNEERLYKDETFYYCPTIVFYDRNSRKKFGALVKESENLPKDISKLIKVIPSGKYLCGYHRGDHINILDTVEDMVKKFNGYELEEWSVHFNILDQFIENDNKNFVTQIQIRVK